MAIKTSALANMPAFPPVAAKLLRVASDENAAVGDMVRLLRSDPALSAEIIRYANSPLFTFACDIRTLDQAAPLLGMRKIRSLALASISRTYIHAVLIMDELRVYWRYSMACALLSEMLARYCSLPEDTAYAAGLLHDIGRLGLMVTHSSEYTSLLQNASAKLKRGEPFDLPEYERSLFGIDHFAAGEWLARKWNLPAELCVVAGLFPGSTEGDKFDLFKVVRTACRIANSIGFFVIENPRGPTYREILDELPPRVAASFPETAESLQAQLEKEINTLDQAAGDQNHDAEMQALLEMERPDSGVAASNGGHAGMEPAVQGKWSLWPAVLAGAVVLAILLVWMRFRG